MILFYCCLGVVALYAFFIFLSSLGWLISPKTGMPISKRIPVTVIVPFRNEEKNLPLLIHSLKNQSVNTPVIFIDDSSTDNSTAYILHAGYDCILSAGEGKKAATATGIEQAHNSFLVFTDADCVFQKKHIEQFMQTQMAGNYDFVYGPVLYHYKNPGLAKGIYFLDQLSLNAFSLGTGNIGLHLYCSGANMAGKKQAMWEASNKLVTSKNLSGDDLTLLNYVHAKGGKIKAITNADLTVLTKGPGTLGEFLGQRLRWGQKTGIGSNFLLFLCSVTVLLACCASILGIIFSLSEHWPNRWYLIPTGKLLIDLLFLFLVAGRLGVKRYLWFFIPAWIFNVAYIPLIALTGLVYKGKWKGRKIKV
jgi:glycosyltransferase involved in cell wall biosynthesis